MRLSKHTQIGHCHLKFSLAIVSFGIEELVGEVRTFAQLRLFVASVIHIWRTDACMDVWLGMFDFSNTR